MNPQVRANIIAAQRRAFSHVAKLETPAETVKPTEPPAVTVVVEDKTTPVEEGVK